MRRSRWVQSGWLSGTSSWPTESLLTLEGERQQELVAGRDGHDVAIGAELHGGGLESLADPEPRHSHDRPGAPKR